MPLPWLVIGAGAALIGASQHSKAKKKNEEAQSYLRNAERKYNRAKESLESAQQETEQSLLRLGTSKKEVLESSVKRFLGSWKKVKDCQFMQSDSLNEADNFAITSTGALELAEMSDIYHDKYSSAATGVVTGGLISLAVSGSLPAVTGALTSAGGALLAGNIAGAAGFAGSALALGAAVTPLAAVAAPVMLFTGFSANAQADENLAEAQKTYKQAKRAVAKMETQETLCRAIAEKADMFNGLLSELNGLFSPVTEAMEKIVRSKKSAFWSGRIKQEELSDDEVDVLRVARAIAGAVKSVLDTPILTKGGDINPNAESECERVRNAIPAFSENAPRALEAYEIAEIRRAAEAKRLAEERRREEKRRVAEGGTVESVAVVASAETAGNAGAVSQPEGLAAINFITSCIAAAALYFAFERSMVMFIVLCAVSLIVGAFLQVHKERIPASLRNLSLFLGLLLMKIGGGLLVFGLAAYFIHPVFGALLEVAIFWDGDDLIKEFI